MEADDSKCVLNDLDLSKTQGGKSEKKHSEKFSWLIDSIPAVQVRISEDLKRVCRNAVKREMEK